jgi:hypothetical protein
MTQEIPMKEHTTEKDLLLENSRVHLEQFHEVEIAEMKEKILKLEEKANRKEEPQYHKVEWNSVA